MVAGCLLGRVDVSSGGRGSYVLTCRVLRLIGAHDCAREPLVKKAGVDEGDRNGGGLKTLLR